MAIDVHSLTGATEAAASAPDAVPPLRRARATIASAVKQVVAIALFLLIFLGLMGLRAWSVLRHRAPGGGDPKLVERWARHLYRGGDED